jgi:hypothetical protein
MPSDPEHSLLTVEQTMFGLQRQRDAIHTSDHDGMKMCQYEGSYDLSTHQLDQIVHYQQTVGTASLTSPCVHKYISINT